MLKKTLVQFTALGLGTLTLAAQPALAKDGSPAASTRDGSTIELHGADKRVRRFTLDTGNVLQPASETAPTARLRKATTSEQKTLKGYGSSGSLKGLKGLKGDDGSEVLPVLRDASGKAYGLPGGLIVTFRESLSDTEARAQLEAAGLVPQEQISPGIWSVQGPAGLESIELANKASASGRFADVSPNFWHKKALK